MFTYLWILKNNFKNRNVFLWFTSCWPGWICLMLTLSWCWSPSQVSDINCFSFFSVLSSAIDVNTQSFLSTGGARTDRFVEKPSHNETGRLHILLHSLNLSLVWSTQSGSVSWSLSVCFSVRIVDRERSHWRNYIFICNPYCKQFLEMIT